MSLLELLRSSSVFYGLTDAQLERVIGISQEEIYDDEAVVFQQGVEGDQLYIISAGQVEVLIRKRPHEPAQTQVYLGRGQVFGEMALLDYGQRSATIRASRDHTVLHTISREAFNDLCSNDTAIGYIVMRNLALDLSFKLRHRNLDLGPGSG